MNGVNSADIDTEQNTIEAIWNGATDSNILQILKSDKKVLPGRMKELIELKNAGYQISFDESSSLYIFTRP